MLQSLTDECKATAGKALVLHIKPKAGDGAEQMQELLDLLQASSSSPVVGTLPKDKHTGKFVELYEAKLGGTELATVDVSLGCADLLSCKDAAEVLNVKKAAMLAAKVMKDFVVTKIEEIIDESKSVKHSKLSELTEEAITDPSKVCGAGEGAALTPPRWVGGGKGASTDPSKVKVKVIQGALGGPLSGSGLPRRAHWGNASAYYYCFNLLSLLLLNYYSFISVVLFSCSGLTWAGGSA